MTSEIQSRGLHSCHAVGRGRRPGQLALPTCALSGVRRESFRAYRHAEHPAHTPRTSPHGTAAGEACASRHGADTMTSSVRPPERMSHPCSSFNRATAQPQRSANQRFAIASAIGLLHVDR